MATLYITEPKTLITGVEGAGKTLFAIQQADLLLQSFNEGEPELYQVNIRGADPALLPKLPFNLSDMAYDDEGKPILDPETGDHIPKWATLPSGSVILVDEAHKVYPQRGPGRPPKHIEMMAEGRQAGVRFILVTQSPASLDSFLRDRISRHFHLERKGGLNRATILEFDHCVDRPQTAFAERKEATVHFWRYPKNYYGWYTSAKGHFFKFRLPLKIWLAILFVPLAAYIAWRGLSTFSALTDTHKSESALLPDFAADTHDNGASRGRNDTRSDVTMDPLKYLERHKPLIDVMPWSAPVYQHREVVAEPDILCVSRGTGGKDGCQCYTEQITKIDIPYDICVKISFDGIYNPYRRPLHARESDSGRAGESRESEPVLRPQSVAVGTSISYTGNMPGNAPSLPVEP